MRRTSYVRKTVLRPNDKYPPSPNIVSRFFELNLEDFKFYEFARAVLTTALQEASTLLDHQPTIQFTSTDRSYVRRTTVVTDVSDTQDQFSLLLTGKEAWDTNPERGAVFLRGAIKANRFLTVEVAEFLISRDHKLAGQIIEEQLKSMDGHSDVKLARFRDRLLKLNADVSARPCLQKRAIKTPRRRAK
jgi:hypothetical protein